MKHERKQWKKKTRGIYERGERPVCAQVPRVIGSCHANNHRRFFEKMSLLQNISMIYELIDKTGHYFERLFRWERINCKVKENIG